MVKATGTGVSCIWWSITDLPEQTKKSWYRTDGYVLHSQRMRHQLLSAVCRLLPPELLLLHGRANYSLPGAIIVFTAWYWRCKACMAHFQVAPSCAY